MPEISLNDDERAFLLAAFIASPRDWFLPHADEQWNVARQKTLDVIASLERARMLDGQPGSFTKLTDLGRKEAKRLSRLKNRNWAKFYKRRRIRIAIVSIVVAALVTLAVLKGLQVI